MWTPVDLLNTLPVQVVGIRLSTLLVIPILMFLVTSADVWNSSVRDDFLSVYRELVKLSELGIEVDELVKELSVVPELISGDSDESVGRAMSVLYDVKAKLEILKSRANYYVLTAKLIKYSIITLLALIPVATYYLLPRAYLRIWFKVRRRWVVKHGRT